MKHADILQRLTLEEKCHLLSGRDFWNSVGLREKGVPSVCLSDGPHGVRRQAGRSDMLGIGSSLPATCFPTAATLANSWDPALAEAVGQALGQEAASQGVGVLLGPGMNIKRSPLCGRNFEYLSEDPYLTGRLAAGYVRGVQKNGISACLKHFAANNAESRRQSSDSVLDERTLREIYLTGFEIAVKASAPKCVMSAYNRVNGVYANENRHLLREILREEWGFQGFVVSDWGGGNDFVEGVRAGCNLEMPSTGGDSPVQLLEAVKRGRIDEVEVDQRVDELLDAVLPISAAVRERKGRTFDAEAHHALARRVCAESAVLLKNDGLLPLKPGARVAVIGDFARHPRYQGAGSSAVNPTRVDSLLDAVQDAPLELVGFAPGYSRRARDGIALRREAAELAGRAEVAIVYIGLEAVSESEGLDRRHMRLPEGHVALLEAVSAANPNAVVLLAAGSPVEMPWIDSCRGLLHGSLCGQAGAGALLDILLGRVNPSGRLAESYPVQYGDCPTAPYFKATENGVEYREGLYVGYRYYETAGQPVRFPFGFGLSYTAFQYSDLALTPGEAAFTVTNTGAMAGAEVAQMYMSARDSGIFRPAKELKGFAKVFLRPGESARVRLPLDELTYRYFNPRTNNFEIEGGEYDILIGASVRDIRLRGTMAVEGTGAPLPEAWNDLPDYSSGHIKAVPDAEFEKLLGRSLPVNEVSGLLGLNDPISRMDGARSLKARLVAKLLTARLNRTLRRGTVRLGIVYVHDTPFRALGKTSGGYVSQDMCRCLVDIVNGHSLAAAKGTAGFVTGFLRQRKNRRRAGKYR